MTSYAPDVMYWEYNIIYVLLLPKMDNLNLVIWKQSDKPNLRDYKITDLYSSKMSMS